MWRPDISYQTNLLCRKTASPTSSDMDACLHLVRYLLKTKTEGILIKGTGPIQVYADAGSEEEGKCVTGLITFTGDTPLSWASRKQDIVTLSMTEAEYVAASAGAQEALWTGWLVNEAIPGVQVGPPELLIDSEGARKLAHNPIHHRRTKHIDRRYHFIREKLEKREMELTWIPGTKNLADMFTKTLTGPALKVQKSKVGMGSAI